MKKNYLVQSANRIKTRKLEKIYYSLRHKIVHQMLRKLDLKQEGKVI